MIPINTESGMIRYDRIDVFDRCGDGCYLSVFFGGDPVGSVDVPMSRDQARELARMLTDVAKGLGPGLMERIGDSTFAFHTQLAIPIGAALAFLPTAGVGGLFDLFRGLGPDYHASFGLRLRL